jgi:outer membrane lipoprotein SlyB
MIGAVAALVDLGNAGQQSIQMQQAVQAGCAHASIAPGDTFSSMQASVKAAVPTAWSNSVTVTCHCTSSSGTGNCSTSGAACGSYVPSAIGGSAPAAGRYITLSASTPYRSIMSGFTTNSAQCVVQYE